MELFLAMFHIVKVFSRMMEVYKDPYQLSGDERQKLYNVEEKNVLNEVTVWYSASV